MAGPAPLAAAEAITDACGVAPVIEMMLPIGVRRRQLRVRTMLVGMGVSEILCEGVINKRQCRRSRG